MNREVSLIMGSDSDLPVVKKALKILDEFSVGYDVNVLSAHRTPELLCTHIKKQDENGVKVFIAFAGMSAHLAGVIASQTIKPVIGVPIKSSLDGFDALLSIVQMPPGIPVATVAIDGGANAAILAVQILSLQSEVYKNKLLKYRQDMENTIRSKNENIKNLLEE